MKKVTSINAIGPSRSGNQLFTINYNYGDNRVFYMKPDGTIHVPTANHTSDILSVPKRSDGERKFALGRWKDSSEKLVQVNAEYDSDYQKALRLAEAFDGPFTVAPTPELIAEPAKTAEVKTGGQPTPIQKFFKRFGDKTKVIAPNNLGTNLDPDLVKKLKEQYAE